MNAPDPVAPLLLPIPGDAPSGTNSRYEPPFIRLEEQTAKLTALGGEPPDWRQVAADAQEVLTTLSKDLLAGVYLARAWFALRGLPGLGDGLRVLEDLIVNHWDSGFPPVERVRARRNACEWLSDQVQAPLADPGIDARERVSCLAVAERLQGAARPRFPEGDTGLAGLLRALAGEAPPVVEAAAPVADAPVARRPAVGGPPTDRESALRHLRMAATWFLDQEPHSPVGYLAQRAADLGGKPFGEVFRELLSNHQPAQQELWHVLGIPGEPAQ